MTGHPTAIAKVPIAWSVTIRPEEAKSTELLRIIAHTLFAIEAEMAQPLASSAVSLLSSARPVISSAESTPSCGLIGSKTISSHRSPWVLLLSVRLTEQVSLFLPWDTFSTRGLSGSLHHAHLMVGMRTHMALTRARAHCVRVGRHLNESVT